MDALLILGGLLLIIAGLVWLIMLAFGTSLLWGMISLLPPLTLLFPLRHWAIARKAVLLSALGVIPLVVGLTLLASHDSQRLEAIIGLKWLENTAQAPAELDIQLAGELYGQPFRPLQGELIDGVLSLREGQDFFARRELSISLPAVEPGPIRLDVLPGDSGELPEVEISWLLPEQELPEARRLSRGYTLHLQLEPKAPNLLVGDLHLVLPPRFKTSLSGHVEVFSNGLRYRAGRVDRSFDSSDTLSHVIEDYLQRRFATRAVKLEHLPQVTFPASELDLTVEASIDGELQQLPVRLSKSAERGWGVPGDRFPVLAAERSSASPAAVPEATAVDAPRVSRPVDRRLRFSMQRLLGNPGNYRNLSMRVHLQRGGTAEGRFVGISPEGLIEIRRNMNGAGGASFAFTPADIERIELLEP